MKPNSGIISNQYLPEVRKLKEIAEVDISAKIKSVSIFHHPLIHPRLHYDHDNSCWRKQSFKH